MQLCQNLLNPNKNIGNRYLDQIITAEEVCHHYVWAEESVHRVAVWILQQENVPDAVFSM